MKKIISAGLLIITLLLMAVPVACNTPAATTETATSATTSVATPPEEALEFPEVPRVSCEKLKEMMDTMQPGLDFVIVDVRDPGTYAEGHIYRAINITYDPFGDPMVLELSLLALPMNKPLVLYCECESGRTSALVALKLWEMGYDKELVEVLAGGYWVWEELGYPTATGSTL